jgi:hypothetical protein
MGGDEESMGRDDRAAAIASITCIASIRGIALQALCPERS